MINKNVIYKAYKAWSNYNKHYYPNQIQCHLTYTCWYCEKSGLNREEVCLHHTWPREMATKESDWYNVKFIQILCKQCHKDIHQRLYDYKPCNLESYKNKTTKSGINLSECIVDGEPMIYWNNHLSYTELPILLDMVITRGKIKKIKKLNIQNICIEPPITSNKEELTVFFNNK